LTYRKLLFIFILFGFILQKDEKAFGFWDEQFSFINDDGNEVIIYKKKSYCKPKGNVTTRRGTYGTQFKSFYIYPLCNFGGVEITYSGLKYNYQRSIDCSENFYICKAAGKFELLKNYENKRRKLEQKLSKEVNEYNKDFEEKENNIKNRILQNNLERRRKEKKKVTLAPWLSYRNNCIRNINNGKNRFDPYDFVDPKDGITASYMRANSCFLYVLEEPKVLSAGYQLPKASIASQIPENFLVARVDSDFYSRSKVTKYNSRGPKSSKGKFINCYEGWGKPFGDDIYFNDRPIFCKFTDQIVPKPSTECLDIFLYGKFVTSMNKEFFCKEMFL